CPANISSNKTSRENVNDNPYQLDNERGCGNTVTTSSSQDNISHDYENPTDYEQNRRSGYIDVLPEDNESYDDVVAPGWVSDDYDDIAEVGH
ncbi:hypothetical protein scyTo_0021086, partial [Scyliorhinus torazame]|nr:hypothetical protein [Scyliorhinus torazame]